MEFERWKVEYENNMKFAIEELKAKFSMKQSALTANQDNADGMTQVNEETGDKEPSNALSSLVDAINNNMAALVSGQDAKHAELVTAMTRPKTATLSNGKTVRIE